MFGSSVRCQSGCRRMHSGTHGSACSDARGHLRLQRLSQPDADVWESDCMSARRAQGSQYRSKLSQNMSADRRSGRGSSLGEQNSPRAPPTKHSAPIAAATGPFAMSSNQQGQNDISRAPSDARCGNVIIMLVATTATSNVVNVGCCGSNCHDAV